MQARTLKLYIDYKSPYAYLAKEPAYRLELETGVEIDWLPYVLDIPAYLGSAKVDAEGRVLEQDRNAHQWRRVRYSYMDVRREANRVGLTIRGTQKIWDSSLAGIGLLHARRQGAHRAYNDAVFERFWKRELDIENPAALKDVLKAPARMSPGSTRSCRAKAGASSRQSRKRPRLQASSACRASFSGRRPVLGPRTPAAHPRDAGRLTCDQFGKRVRGGASAGTGWRAMLSCMARNV
jgi:2-hydroxychromene-2-carboxylate isomerase